MVLEKVLLSIALIRMTFGIIGPPVKCYGAVPKISEGEYFVHDNGTYLLRVSTTVLLDLDLHQRSCFQVNIRNKEEIQIGQNNTDEAVTSLFYSVKSPVPQVRGFDRQFRRWAGDIRSRYCSTSNLRRPLKRCASPSLNWRSKPLTCSIVYQNLNDLKYLTYEQSYDIRSSYQFGIAELQTYCKCDCPTGEHFCTQEYKRKTCSKGEVCITEYHGSASNAGCNVQNDAATLCCEISARPYGNRKFTAISLVDPRPQTTIEIDIYTLYQEKWSLFRRYQRTVIPHRANNLRLNGFENVAEMYIRITSESPRFYLKNGDKWYFYEDKPEFKLMDDRRVNGLFERDPDKFGWLRYYRGEWNVGDINTLATLHDPVVTNCKAQKYSDRFQVSAANVVVLRNATGKINAEPFLGAEVTEKQTFIEKVRLTHANFGLNRDSSLNVKFKTGKAPSLKLDIKLHQKMSIIAHIYASYLEDFTAEICLDKNSHRYLNITLVKSYGEFNIEIFRDRASQELDLIVSMSTSLPFATNYTEIIAMPGFVSASRLVCLSAANKPTNRLCKLAAFRTEPIEWFELKNTFIKTEGKCPGCNKEDAGGLAGFLGHLNPHSWFNGINSFSEWVALVIEIVLYIIVLIVLIGVWRKCLYPFLKWALCPSRTYEIGKPVAV